MIGGLISGTVMVLVFIVLMYVVIGFIVKVFG